jgi:hypothetical protein
MKPKSQRYTFNIIIIEGRQLFAVVVILLFSDWRDGYNRDIGQFTFRCSTVKESLEKIIAIMSLAMYRCLVQRSSVQFILNIIKFWQWPKHVTNYRPSQTTSHSVYIDLIDSYPRSVHRYWGICHSSDHSSPTLKVQVATASQKTVINKSTSITELR